MSSMAEARSAPHPKPAAARAAGDAIATRYRHTTPWYDIVILTSPARIESLRIDPEGCGDHFGVVNNFGPRGSSLIASYGSSILLAEDHVHDAGRPHVVEARDNRLVLDRIPVGDRGLLARWTFEFAERTFDMGLDWLVERPQVDLWEAGWKLDGIARHIAGTNGRDLTAGEQGSYAAAASPFLAWWEDDPRYAHTLVAALVSGSADRGDNIVVRPNHNRPVTWGAWFPIHVPGGAALPAGTVRGGRWRIGASARAADLAFARTLASSDAGTPAAPAASVIKVSDREAAIAWGASLPPPGITPKGVPSTLPDGATILCGDAILAAFVPSGSELKLRIFAIDGGRWTLQATGGAGQRYLTAWPDLRAGAIAVTGNGLSRDGAAVSDIAERWTLRADPVRFHVEATDTPRAETGPLPGREILAYPGGRDRGAVGRYDVLWSPHLRPQADLIIGQHAMRAPGLAVQHGAASFALVPDLTAHREYGNFGPEHSPRHFGLYLDFDVASRMTDAPLLTFGVRHQEWVYLEVGVEQGGYYCRGLDTAPPPGPHKLSFDLLVSAVATPHSIVGDVQRLHWQQIGHRYFAQSLLPQTQGADAAFDEAWSYWSRLYDSVKINGVECGAVRVDADFPPDIMFTAWFNALRTSYATFVRGRTGGDTRLMQQGHATLELLLSAPRKDGAFPTLVRFTPQGLRWFGSHKNFANQMPWGPQSYHTMDMSWAAYTVLRWYQDLEADERALAFARDYGEFLVAHQLPGGAIPSWFAMADLAPNPHLRESAQTAASALFLAELAWVTEDDKFRAAAEAAGRFVVEQCVKQQRWDDFEVYYSNSPKSEGASDPISGQSGQDTLSMHFAAAALLRLQQLTGDRAWLAWGEVALATMLEYQATWRPTFLSVYTFGGFSVQNTDQEWLDARQSQLALTLLDYAAATGRADYAERGIAALRSGYALMNSPSAEAINPRHFDDQPTGWGNENFAHSAFDTLTRSVPTPCYDWGMGSAAAGYAEARTRFGDVWVDVTAEHAFGIDHITVVEAAFAPGSVKLRLASPDRRKATVKVHGMTAGQTLLLVVNGAEPVSVNAEEAGAGVSVAVDAAVRLVHNPARCGPVLAGQPLTVAVRVEGSGPLAAIELHYRHGDAGWAALALSRGDGSTWTGTLPAAATAKRGGSVEYYFTATGTKYPALAPEVDPSAVAFRQRVY